MAKPASGMVQSQPMNSDTAAAAFGAALIAFVLGFALKLHVYDSCKLRMRRQGVPGQPWSHDLGPKVPKTFGSGRHTYEGYTRTCQRCGQVREHDPQSE